ncbi:preprotein translocase subunit SecD [Anaerotruncus colihominis]|uniref:Protein translocase subunit SecD n=1 Tax=Anaerotruncus colihominis TaxID=169435 RepID=A0A1Y4EP23_9FIRM|nr:SecD/SecF family protein translocase subunit [Anaerotruncus colihominis]OUO69321.1 protein translocase subunit SecD [Anaerotruncus colihominis]OUP68615.1 protein translocase subunit SecD [Anaerotruncus colihominis]OUP73147.1 protein translocase subunit SecD [Anaerotruncus colihominis]RGE69661.1 SecD/SecF family protein translocase subunit [Anaerotruncus colihominis]UOX65572.1 SecD/SecF family protein translocase subunit [Anaerotruncus colihominis]
MRKVGKPVVFVVVAIIIVFTTLAFFGISTSYGDITTTYIKGVDDIRWGIDIRGGVDVTFTPPEGYDATPEEMAAAESIIKVRLVSQNITDYETYVDEAKDRIIVRFPWKEGETDFNPEQAVKELGETALLTFRENQSGPVVIEGKHVKSASAEPSPDGRGSQVKLELTDEGAELFSDATGRLIGQQISIWMDDTMISAPRVDSQIPGGIAYITGGAQGFDVKEAKALADRINGGALPFKLETENFSTISPTLGFGARDAMVTAGVIAFVLVAIFIIIMYRMCGVVASIALVGQVAGMIACLTGFFAPFPSFTLTLPGIAGIILSIGMGVDANVITSERIKEELRNGKTLDGAIDSGFQRTFSAIFDGNITMVIVAIILMGAFGPPQSIFNSLLSPIFRWFGPSATGAIYSFGFTLIVGVIFNFIMGVTASRLMLKSVSKFKPFKKPWLYGGAK